MNGFELIFDLLRQIVVSFRENPIVYRTAIWFLAWTFLWSGVEKLRQPILAAFAMVDFGVVRHVRPAFGYMLAAGEIGLAFFLAVGLLPRFTIVVTTCLYWIFVFLIARSLSRGDSFACLCFGDSSSTLSKLTLLRTLALACLATLAIQATGGVSAAVDLPFNLLSSVTALAILASIAIVSYISQLIQPNSKR